MEVLFAVPWIEVEFGQRPEGFKVYDSLNECVEDTKVKSRTGCYDGGYFGPERPLRYYETPDEISGQFPTFVNELKFKSEPKSIV